MVTMPDKFSPDQNWNGPQTKRTMSPILLVLVIVLIASGIFFRWANLGQKPHSFDEPYTSLRIAGYTEAEFVQQLQDGVETKTAAQWLQYQQLAPDRDFGDAVQALATQTEHTPLYYLLARLGIEWFGSSVVVTRGVATLLGVLSLPCGYWLCRELFASSMVGWTAVVLMAVSPFHVLYAQEARQYTLWIVAIFLSSTALLRAIRLKTRASWGWYALALTVSLYSHLVSVLLAFSHGLYVLWHEKFRISKTAIAYLLSTTIGFVAFSPWLVAIALDPPQFREQMHHLYVKLPLFELGQIWVRNLGRIFLDFNTELPLSGRDPSTYAMMAVTLLTLYAGYILCRRAPQKVSVFLLLLMGVTTLVFVLPDILLGGRRSGSPRYILPAVVGLELMVAYCFTTQLFSGTLSALKRKLWQIGFSVLISVGLLSCVLITQSGSWWLKDGYQIPAIAHVINASPRPFLIYPLPSWAGDMGVVGRIMPLMHWLKPEVQVQVLVQPALPAQVPTEDGDRFVYKPQKELRMWLEQQYTVVPVYDLQTNQELPIWKLQ